MFNRNIHQPTQHLYLYTSGFSSGLRCTTYYKRPSLEESFIMHSRLVLACSHALSHSLRDPSLCLALMYIQVFSSLRGLCSMLPWHSMVAAPCHVPLTSCSASSDSVLVLCDACWTGHQDGPLSSTCGLMILLGLRLPVSRGPGLSWDFRRAFHRSPPNDFDNHAPSSHGLSVRPSRCTLCWPVHAFLLVTDDHHA